MHCYREVSLGTQYGETMVINKIKKNNCWLKNSLQFDRSHDHDVISLRPSKHLWFLTTFVLSATKIHIEITCLYLLFSLHPHLIVITKDYYACTSSPYNTNWVKGQRQPYIKY